MVNMNVFFTGLLKLNFGLFLITQVYGNPQSQHANSGLLGLGSLFGSKEPSGSFPIQGHPTAAIENINQNQQFFDQSSNLIGQGLEDSSFARVPVGLNAPGELITNNFQTGVGDGGIRNVQGNEQIFDQSSNTFGFGNQVSRFADIPVGANVPLKVITQNTQIAQGAGGIQNFEGNNQRFDQSSNLFGVGNTDSSFAQVPVGASAPLRVITQNTQISNGQGDIENVRNNNQIADQSVRLRGFDNQKNTGVQAPIAASAPVSALANNFQFVRAGDGGNIHNQDISNQLFDQSTNLQGQGNEANSIAKAPIGVRLPVNALGNNEQIVEGSDGEIRNIALSNQRADQSSNLMGQNLRQSDLVKAPVLVGGDGLNLLNRNRQTIIDNPGFNNIGVGPSGGITNLKGNLQETNLSDNLEGSNIRKTEGLLVAPQALLGVQAVQSNSQRTAGGSIENTELNVQRSNTDTKLTGNDISKFQIGQLGPKVNVIAKLLNKNEQITGVRGENGNITNIFLNSQDSSNRFIVNGSNTRHFQLLDGTPDLIVDLGLAELSDQKTGQSGSVINKHITKQTSDNTIIMEGDNNTLFRAASVHTQGVVKLRIGNVVKQTTGLLTHRELTDEECEAINNDIIIQEQKNDIIQKGKNNKITKLVNVGGQLKVDANILVDEITRLRCRNRKTTTRRPPTQPPTLPPTQPPTLPPTQPPTEPPTQPPTQPPTLPPTQPPTLPPTQPPTLPPTQPPTLPPTQPPTLPPTQPPTLPPTQPPTLPPTQPPTLPPTQPPTLPPTQPPTLPPTQPPTQPPTLPPTQPPTQPPTLPPTQPPTLPPTQPPTLPPTLPPTPPPTPTRRCYRKYCRKWRKMRYFCF